MYSEFPSYVLVNKAYIIKGWGVLINEFYFWGKLLENILSAKLMYDTTAKISHIAPEYQHFEECTKTVENGTKSGKIVACAFNHKIKERYKVFSKDRPFEQKFWYLGVSLGGRIVTGQSNICVIIKNILGV